MRIINKIIGIYYIISPSNKVYIGQSTDINKRFKNYYNLEKSVSKQIKLYRSLLKYGVHNHCIGLLEECKVEDLTDREGYWQDFFDSINTGLNCIRVKTSDKTGYMSEETKKKVSEGRKGKNSGENHHFYGKKRKGTPYTEEQKLIVKERQKGAGNSFSKKVLDTETGEIFGCVGEICRKYNISISSLYKKLNPKDTTINDTVFKYITKEDYNQYNDNEPRRDTY